MPPDEDKPTFTADELAQISPTEGEQEGAPSGDAAGDKATEGADKGAEGGKPTEGKGQDGKPTEGAVDKDGKPTEGAVGADGKPAAQAKGDKGQDKGDKGQAGKTLAGGDKAEPKPSAEAEKAKAAYWPEDWREKLAQSRSAGDKKVYDKELKRLQRIADPSVLYASMREGENILNGGSLLKRPDKDAKPEEVEAFRKALGIPEKPEGYLEKVELPDGAVIGEADKPLVGGFLEAIHGATTPQEFVNKALGWYYGRLEQDASNLDQQDDKFKRESVAALKDEWGAGYDRERRWAIAAFKEAEGGSTNAELESNPEAIANVVLSARSALTGDILGNHPGVLKWLRAVGMAAYPATTWPEDGQQDVQSLDQQIAAYEKMMVEDRPRYNKEEKKYLALLERRNKFQAQQQARA